MAQQQFIKASAVKNFCRDEKGKRCSAEFLAALDAHVRKKLSQAAGQHNGGRKTLDASVAGYVGIT